MEEETGIGFLIRERAKINLRANLVLRELGLRDTPFGVMLGAKKIPSTEC